MKKKNEEFVQFCYDDKPAEVKDALDKGQDPNCTDEFGNTGLMRAVPKSQAVMEIILQHPQFIAIANCDGLTAFHIAASIGNYIAIKMLARKPELLLNSMTNWNEHYERYGMTPLMLAVRTGKVDAVKEILKIPGVDLIV